MKRIPFDWERLQIRTLSQLMALEAIADGPFGYIRKGTRIIHDGRSRRVVGWFSWISGSWIEV